eukprot:GFYU01010024.1.p1 GENE.GFYU01010024.1~~GFYU01010024.1.p1  ORF type:complete len:426 (+),score=115.39 GFYU01010024.1:142-1278(+)
MSAQPVDVTAAAQAAAEQAPAQPSGEVFVFQPVVYDIQKSVEPNKIELAAQKHKARAERFGVDVVKPNPKNLMSSTELAKHMWGREGFVTGMDLTSDDAQKKKDARAARFGIQSQPNEDLQEIMKRKARGERFGAEESNLDKMDTDLRDPRREPTATAELRPSVLHLYGTDNMSTQDVEAFFAVYLPSWVEWLDDSSCNIIFEDEMTVKRVLHNLSVPITDGDTNPNPWRASIDFKKGNKKERLQMRIATSEDVKPAKKKPSKWDRNRRPQHQHRQQKVKDLRSVLGGGVVKKNKNRNKNKKGGKEKGAVDKDALMAELATNPELQEAAKLSKADVKKIGESQKGGKNILMKAMQGITADPARAAGAGAAEAVVKMED